MTRTRLESAVVKWSFCASHHRGILRSGSSFCECADWTGHSFVCFYVYCMTGTWIIAALYLLNIFLMNKNMHVLKKTFSFFTKKVSVRRYEGGITANENGPWDYQRWELYHVSVWVRALLDHTWSSPIVLLCLRQVDMRLKISGMPLSPRRD